MKKEFSFYEFVGIIIPGSTLLYGLNILINIATKQKVFDVEKIGETIMFLIIAYGVGHLVQSVGNMYESIIWKFYGGMPTAWLTQKNRFGKTLFEESMNRNIVEKVVAKYGIGIKDTGLLVYNGIFLAGKSGRIDVFNGNYSLFRGLAVTFLLLAIVFCYYFNWWQSMLSFIPFLFMTRRMIRFAKHYAKETYRTFLNIS